jgi:hypothetical protein
LLVQIRGLKSQTEPFSNFFFQRILFPMGLQWVSAAHDNVHMRPVTAALNFMATDTVSHEFLNRLFGRSHPSAELPQIYKPFDHFSIDVYVCVHDIQLLMNVFNASKLLPERVNPEDLARTPAQYEHLWYSCRAYPRTLLSRSKSDGGPLFEPPLSIIDRLVEIRLYKTFLTSWLSVAQAHEDISVQSFLQSEVSKPLGNFLKRCDEIVDYMRLGRLRAKVWLSLVEAHLAKWTDGQVSGLGHLDQQFRQMSQSAVPSDRTLTTVVRRLKALDSVTLYERWRIILDVMTAATDRHKSGFISEVLLRNESGCFLSTFIVLNCFAMRLTPFAALCTDGEKQAWLKLESVILTVLHRDKTLLRGLITHDKVFEQVAAQHIG